MHRYAPVCTSQQTHYLHLEFEGQIPRARAVFTELTAHGMVVHILPCTVCTLVTLDVLDVLDHLFSETAL